MKQPDYTELMRRLSDIKAICENNADGFAIASQERFLIAKIIGITRGDSYDVEL